jgi:DNA-binding NarL/FixJ family response regulator
VKRESPYPEDPQYDLTAREIEVLQLVAHGRTNKEIAQAMDIGTGTVKAYLSGVCLKLRARNRTEAVAKALLTGKIQ